LPCEEVEELDGGRWNPEAREKKKNSPVKRFFADGKPSLHVSSAGEKAHRKKARAYDSWKRGWKPWNSPGNMRGFPALSAGGKSNNKKNRVVPRCGRESPRIWKVNVVGKENREPSRRGGSTTQRERKSPEGRPPGCPGRAVRAQKFNAGREEGPSWGLRRGCPRKRGRLRHQSARTKRAPPGENSLHLRENGTGNPENLFHPLTFRRFQKKQISHWKGWGEGGGSLPSHESHLWGEF